MVGVVLEELGDVVDFDSCIGPNAKGFAEDRLGVNQQIPHLHAQLPLSSAVRILAVEGKDISTADTSRTDQGEFADPRMTSAYRGDPRGCHRAYTEDVAGIRSGFMLSHNKKQQKRD